MNDLEDRLEHAFSQIAGAAGFNDDPDTARSSVAERALRTPPARRMVPWAAIAAAAVVVAGVGGLWVTRGDSSDPGGDRPTIVPTIPEPDEVAILSPELRLGAPSRSDPVSDWVRGIDTEYDGRFFVHRDGSGRVDGTLNLGTWPGGWDESFGDGSPVDIGDGIEARMVTNAEAIPSQVIGWVNDGVVSVVSSTGAVSDEDLLSLAHEAAAQPVESLEAPAGYTESGATSLVSSVSYPSDLSVRLLRSDEPVDAEALAFSLIGVRPTELTSVAWFADLGGAEDGVVMVYVQVDEKAVVQIQLSRLVDFESLVEGVELVPADTVEILPLGYPPGNAEVTAFGELSWGRWVLQTWAVDGGSCSNLDTSFAGGGGGGGCPRDGGPPTCWLLAQWNPTAGQTFLVAVDHPVDQIGLVIDNDDPLAMDIEQSDGFTFGYLAMDDELTPEQLRPTIDGVETTC